MTKVRCPDCKKGFYDPDLYERCFKCNQKADGKVLCECGNNFYDPKVYACCYECHMENVDASEADEDDEDSEFDADTQPF